MHPGRGPIEMHARLPFLLLFLLPHAVGQYIQGSFLFNQTIGQGNRNLTARLQDNADLSQTFYPNKYRLPTDFYVFQPPDRNFEYTQNVIFDPCRGYEHNCCFDTYGVPEYLQVEGNSSLPSYGTRTLQLDDGTPMDSEISRRPDDELFIDESCEGENLPAGRTDCVMARVARRAFSLTPRCWNWNASVIADAGCRSPADGSPLKLCLEVGVTQTAFILECGGKYATSERCGTYLEIHRPARSDKLSEVRLRAMYPSGYRMTVISTTYKGDGNRTLCYDPIKQGKYEVWWVMRTLYEFIVERRIPFTVISPECDWDGTNNRYLPYATLYNGDGSRKARALSGLHPFDPEKLLFTRPRTEGTPARPGVGMGSTLVPITDTTYPPTSTFEQSIWHNEYTYRYIPDKPEYTVKRGVIQPTLEEQQALAILISTRGYRRLADVPAEELLAMKTQVKAKLYSQRDAGVTGGGSDDAPGVLIADAVAAGGHAARARPGPHRSEDRARASADRSLADAWASGIAPAAAGAGGGGGGVGAPADLVVPNRVDSSWDTDYDDRRQQVADAGQRREDERNGRTQLRSDGDGG